MTKTKNILAYLRKLLLFCTPNLMTCEKSPPNEEYPHTVKSIQTGMKVFQTIVELQNQLFADRKAGKTIGLVPTMGALHAGHASLVERSVKENDVTVVSVFVNPTQFNDKNDLKTYPRTLDADCQLLERVGADYVLAPSVEEMYPTPDTRHFEYPPVTTVMEGAHRPGHFNGVCQVVSRLFYIVRPQRAYFGEKDWQQIAVIKAMVKALSIDVQIVECDIVREADGLALSSRNTLLSSTKPSARAATTPRRTRCARRSSGSSTRSTLRKACAWNTSPSSTATPCSTWRTGKTAPTSWAASPYSAARHPSASSTTLNTMYKP